VSIVEQELPILPEHMLSPHVSVGFLLLKVFCVVLCRSLFVYLPLILLKMVQIEMILIISGGTQLNGNDAIVM
jgi:hypothetical protein